MIQSGDRSVTLGQFIQDYNIFLDKSSLPDNLRTRKIVANALADQLLLTHWADSTQLFEQPDHGQKFAEGKDQLLLNHLYETEVEPNTEPDEAYLRQLFQWSKIRVHTRHLFARSEAASNQIVKRLAAGESWDNLAREIFRDPVLASNGGDIGFTGLGDLDPAYEQVSYTLQDGEISAPVRTREGYSIIQLVEREIDPFLNEEEFQIRRGELRLIGREHLRFDAVRKYTDEVAADLEIVVNIDGVQAFAELIGHANFIDTEEQIAQPDLTILVLGDGTRLNFADAWKQFVGLDEQRKDRIRTADQVQSLFKGLVIQDELIRIARGARLDRSAAYLADVEMARKQYIFNFVINNLAKRAALTESELLKYYESEKTIYTDPIEYELSEILVEDGDSAAWIMEQLNKGADFADLATSHSLRGATAGRGGYLGWVTLDELGSFAGHLDRAAQGDIVGPVNLAGLQIIVAIHAVKQARQLSFVEARDEVAANFSTLAQRRAYDNFRDALATRTPIQIDSTLLKNFIL